MIPAQLRDDIKNESFSSESCGGQVWQLTECERKIVALTETTVTSDNFLDKCFLQV